MYSMLLLLLVHCYELTFSDMMGDLLQVVCVAGSLRDQESRQRYATFFCFIREGGHTLQ